ncbi:hypothetical protein [Prevotella sp.]
METTELQYPNEEKFKNNLVSYLQEHGLVDEMLPDAIDIEGKWLEIAQAYLPDGTREFSAYPTVSLGWMMYVGMAVAKYWDEDWELYNKVENLYTYLRNRIDYDHMDDYICEKVLLLSTEDHQRLASVVGECAARTNSLLHHLGLAPGSPEAFHSYVAALHQLYTMGAAMQLKTMGYHMTKL